MIIVQCDNRTLTGLKFQRLAWKWKRLQPPWLASNLPQSFAQSWSRLDVPAPLRNGDAPAEQIAQARRRLTPF